MTQSSASSRVSIPGTISTSDVFWSRTRAIAGILKTETTGLRSQSSRASAAFPSVATAPLCGNVIAALPPQVGVNWRTAIERTEPIIALAVRRLISRGTWLICKLFRPQAAGKLFSFRVALVNGSAKPTNGVSNRFFFSPNYLSWLAAHVVNSSNGVGACPTKEFPKQERMFPRIA